ncbi:MAG: Dabb family protein [Sebaldella sp.]|nr:Dabb family protein [Sebaldella sp.]
MIGHIVFFKFKNYPEGLKEVKENLLSLKDKIKEIKKLEIGEDFSREERSYDLALYSTFESKEELDSYAVNPEHLKIINDYVKVYCDHTKVVDYKI